MELSNITGLEKPLTKLIETIGEGVGVLGNATFKFDAKKIRRVGEAEAEVEKQKIIKHAEAQVESSQVMERAAKRLALEQYNKQINIENVVYKSKLELDGMPVSDEAVDRDWAAKFISVAQDISDEEMQDILARILAGEIQQPRTYSRRLLEVVKNLSHDELIRFTKLAAYASHTGHVFVRGTSTEALRRLGLTFSEFIQLCEIGLANSDNSIIVSFDEVDDEEDFIGGKKLIVDMSDCEKATLDTLLLTVIGKQLALLLQRQIEPPADLDEYLEEAAEELRGQGAKVGLEL